MRGRALWRYAAATAVLVVALALWVAVSLSPPESASPLSEDFTLSGVTVVVPDGKRVVNRTVRVRDGIIEAMGPHGSMETGGDAISDYAGHFMLPGLIDLHTHFPPDNALKLTRYFALLYLAHGVTSVRDAGDLDGTATPAARAVASSDLPSPRVFACGPFVTRGEPIWANSLRVDELPDAGEAVAEVASAGFDCVKAYEGLTIADLQTIKLAAVQAAIPVIGHVPRDLAYEDALIPDVQHFYGVPPPETLTPGKRLARLTDWDAVDDARMHEIVRTTVDYGLANTPTLVLNARALDLRRAREVAAEPPVALMPRMYRDVVWDPNEGIPFWRNLADDDFEKLAAALEKKKELLRRLWAAGAVLHVGTDVQQPFVVPGAAVLEEMRLFAQAGIPPGAVYAIASRHAAKALPVQRLGTLTPGAPADFLLYREDPTEDLAALSSLAAVVARGRLYTRAELDAAVERYRAHYAGFVVDRLSVAAAKRIMRNVAGARH